MCQCYCVSIRFFRILNLLYTPRNYRSLMVSVGFHHFIGYFVRLCKVTMLDLKIDNMSTRSGLPTIFEEACDFAQRHSLQLHMQQLTRTLLGFENSWSYPTARLDVRFGLCFPFFMGIKLHMYTIVL